MNTQRASSTFLSRSARFAGAGLLFTSLSLGACVDEQGEWNELEPTEEAESAIGEVTTRKVIGAVGIAGSNMLGANRLTLGPCPGTVFKTPSANDSAISVKSGQLGEAKWDCLNPEFFFGANRDALVNISAGFQEFTFTPPAGYKCDGFSVYGPVESKTISKSGNRCTVSLRITTAPGDIYLWYYVKPTLTVKLGGGVALSDSDTLGPNRLTQGPCPGTLFRTATSLSSSITIDNTQLGRSRWECGDPSFFFGDALGKNVSLDAGTHVFDFTPPPGYTCDAYSLYGTRDSDSFTNTGNKCSVTLSLSANPSDLYLWFYVKQTNPPTSCDRNYFATDVWYSCLFAGTDSSTGLFLRAQLWSEINKNWGVDGPQGTPQPNDFSYEWRRKVTFPAGTYVFHTNADDGVRLDVGANGSWEINDWSEHAARQVDSAPIYLDGEVPLLAHYYERANYASVRIWWDKIN
ncbi:PA14 domain-containing protein [Polyangium mundeleinium]|uniref:PA14 domain-containing protein n=1 Tax=Polyangium mundeleinium TaxID=2995306 RepID=A0ABT5EZ66_9BACT|nr:PA14 domain-containing protein [Polyangium mundeleinium]MDC0747076.1 PA14 domain-containing protein [Polyangium mundeleinium]